MRLRLILPKKSMPSFLYKLIFTSLCGLYSMTVLSQTSFSDGYKEGYKKGYCGEEIRCIPPIPPIAPIASPGFNKYSDGYARGIKDGTKAKSEGKNKSSGSYSNPQVYVTDPNTFSKSFNKGFNSTFNVLAQSMKRSSQSDLLKIPAVRLNTNNNLNGFKFIFLSKIVPTEKISRKFRTKAIEVQRESDWERENHFLPSRRIMPRWITEDSKEVLNAGGLDSFFSKNRNCILFAFPSTEPTYELQIVNLRLVDANKNIIYSGTSSSMLSWGQAIKKIMRNLKQNGGKEYSYDSTIILKPNPQIEKLKKQEEELKKQEEESLRNKAIIEIKKLKELLDLEIITKEEFEKKSNELKAVILK